MPFEYEYPRPAVSVDIVATREKSGGRELLLIQRNIKLVTFLTA